METKTKILIAAGVLTVGGVVGYIAYNKLKEQSEEKNSDDLIDKINSGESPAQNHTPAPRPSGGGSKPVSTGFPLKRKSKGQLVRDLQTALKKYYGAAISVDGDFGPKTEAALQAKGLPTVIDSQAFAMIITGKATAEKGKNDDKNDKPKGNTTPEVNSKSLAASLHAAIDKDDIFKALDSLKKIKNKAKYTYVNEEFKKTRYWTFTHGYVSRSVVTALHEQFTSSEYKKKINAELYRIGLKYDGEKWSLSGPAIIKIKLRRRATVFTSQGMKGKFPRGTELGYYVGFKNGLVVSDSKDDYLIYSRPQDVVFFEDLIEEHQQNPLP